MLRGVKFILDYILSVLKVTCVFLFALFLPRLFLYYAAQGKQEDITNPIEHSSFKLGLENIQPATIKRLKSHSIGLITNHTGKDQAGRRNIDILLEKGIKIKTIFTPKHGYNANVAESYISPDGLDEATNIPIISWADIHTDDRWQKAMRGIDIFIFDVQDSGMRQGYVTTLIEVMKTAAAYKKKVIILDRPNLLGSYMEGSFIDDTVIETNNALPVPIRHGMTVGELAQYFNTYVLEKPIALQVVPMENYTRHADLPTSLACNLSPNITNISSCYGYSFLGLLGEIAPFDIGIGTDKAFQCMLLPESVGVTKQQWYELRTLLKNYGVESKWHRYFNDHTQHYYSGLKIHIKDINNFSSFNTLLAVLNFFKNTGVSLTFSKRFDSAVGTRSVREFFEGIVERKTLEQAINQELSSFYTKAMNSFIYKPLPQVVRV
ncbi:MAG TPA: exo-beta-N-acetylmuramidase NamZ domain-containing protein [Candidatus Babeliales bacterium]|nr:exo-beta-N-acetylmuramidase NamZ domain-containing protein [Candidatus Babeliales bacterium]